MKQTLIKLSDTHYIVVDDTTPTPGNFVYSYVTNTIVIFTDLRHFSDETYKRITHSTQPELLGKGWMQSVKPLLLSEVEEAINGYSIHNMAVKYCDNHYKRQDWEENYYNYEAGFKAHQELVKDKLFTIEDMKQMFQEGVLLPNKEIINWEINFNNLIENKLPKTEWEIEFNEQDKIKLI